MTGQSLLDRMELLNQELQLQSGEANVTRGLLALNVAQDYFESLAASRGKLFSSSTGTVATSASTETTAFPAGVLRIDRLHLLDSNSRPKRELVPAKRTGGHVHLSSWPLNLFVTSGSGEPKGYWTNATSIYWDPLPDATYTVRYYGFVAASDITAGGTFAYPDVVALPIASFAVRIIKEGVDDDGKSLASLAMETFMPVLDLLSMFNRDGGRGLEYTECHST